MIRERSLIELSRKSRTQFDRSKKAHSSGMRFGQPWLTTFKWEILPPNGSFRGVSALDAHTVDPLILRDGDDARGEHTGATFGSLLGNQQPNSATTSIGPIRALLKSRS